MRKVFGFILRFRELFAIAIILLLIIFFKGCGKANATSGKEGCVNATADRAESETNVDTMDVYFPIIATYRYMPIIGDTPQYAVSYVDMLGHPVMKILMMSGMDSSLQLWDIP